MKDTGYRIKKLLNLCKISVGLNGYAARIGIRGSVVDEIKKPI